MNAPHSSGHSIECFQLMGSNHVQTPEGMAARGYAPIGIKQPEVGDIVAMEGLPDDWVISVLGEKVDDTVVTITAETSSVKEGTATVFTVTRAAAAATHLSVMVDVSETQHMIFSGVPDSISSVRWPIRVDILANATDATFMVLTDDDDVDETDSVITATVLAKNGYTVGTSGSASVTIEDNDGTAQQRQTRGTPDAPNVFIATANGPAQVELIWTTPKSGTATGYDIQWSADGETGWQAVEPLDDGADTMYRHTGLTSGTTYHYRMRYLTEDGPGEWTYPVAATTARLNSFATGVPTISGTAQVGERLTADASGIADEDGLENVSFSYQWMADGTDIGGATGSVYALAEADEGKVIKVRVSFTDDVGNDEELTSVATDAVGAAPRSPLTASLENVATSHDGSDAFTFDLRFSEEISVSYRTLRDHVFTVSGGMVKNASRLEQSSNMGWRIEVRPNANDEVTVVLPVTGDCADTGAICAEDGRKLSSRLELTVSGPESQQQAVQNSPATGQPTISGTNQVGETLTADTTGIADENGLDDVTYTYQWTAGGSDIDGATGSSITLTASQQGQTVQVRVSFTDDNGFSESRSSEATTAVAATANHAATGLPTIGGTAQVSQTLTVSTSDIDDEDGLNNVSFSYQWIASGSDIHEATGSSYTLTPSQQDQTIQVRVSFTDDAEHSETLTSVATVAVAAKPADPLTASFSNIPATHNGTTFTFDLTFSENVKAGYERIRDDAFNASGGDIIKAQRREQGTNQYWTITVKPDGNGSVSITLPATTDCDATGAICTYDDRALSHSTAVTVTGPG